MLSPTQKNLSEEDSSGSDTGSGVEPETDRFGFILTSRSTAGSVGPAPELVRQREAKWIDILAQWDRILLKKTSKVKVQCQKGIPASLRARCWPLLCGAADRLKKNENLYKSLDSEPALQSWVDVIERDLDRQFPFHEMFLSKDGHGQRGLFGVLKAYTQYKPNEGYCQAQGPVAAVLLMNMPAEEAFWCLVQISEQYLPGYYSPLLEGVLFDAALLMWVLKRTCPAAHRHLQHHGVEPLMFATDWLMCLFTRHLPFNMVLRVWDLFFCYGVRVLLQVAVVLVRRVLGRAEQRKQCQGQLETLERLRGIKEQVQEEDDAFIAEVCSVPLSAKDLEKKTEKEVEKWRKDRPSSTFDPRSRCLGYQMAWATTLQNHEEEEKEKIEKGNLSVPLSRSSSTLSLSPFMSNNKRRKWGKGNAGEWESSGKVMRHLSMGAKEDWRSWREPNSKTVQKEDVVLKEYIKQSESQLTAHIKQKEAKCTDNIKNITTEQVGQNVKEQTGKEETSITDMEKRQCKATEEPVVSEQTRETNVETEPTQCPAKDQTLEDSLQPTECTTQCQQERDSDSQSQVLEEHKSNNKDGEIEAEDQSRETEKQMVESAAEDDDEVEKNDDADTNTEVETEANVQQTEGEAVTEISNGPTEISHSDTEGDVNIPSVKSPTTETETGQQEITEHNLQGDVFEGKHSSTETLTETHIEKEAHAQNVSDTAELTQDEEKEEKNTVTQDVREDETLQRDTEEDTDLKQEAVTLLLHCPECNQPNEGTDLAAEMKAEIPVSDDAVSESSQAFAPCSEVMCDAESEPTQEEEDEHLTKNAEQEQTQAEETQTAISEEASDDVEPRQTEVTSYDGESNLTTEPQGKMSSEDAKSPEQPVSDENIATMCANEKSQECVQENTAEETDVLTSVETTDSNAESHANVQSEESLLMKEQDELRNTLAQASSRRNSRSSGDFCIRRSSTSRGCRMVRRLSEELFTVPQKTSQSQPITYETGVNHNESEAKSVSINPTQTHPDLDQTQKADSSLSEDVAGRVETQQETPGPPKRFGLFRKLKGEQPKRNKTKGKTKMQVPKILIQDFSDGMPGIEIPAEEDSEEKLSSRERRRRRREQERRQKEEERLRKKREKELEKVMQQEKRKMQMRGKSLQVQTEEKQSSDDPQPTKTGSQTNSFVASYAESYF